MVEQALCRKAPSQAQARDGQRARSCGGSGGRGGDCDICVTGTRVGGSVEEAGDSSIIVTANRVDSRVQDVPVSVTAVISNDMTDGYGPGEYAIRRALAGEYQVRVNGFDADRINPNGPGHVLIRLIRDFARPGVRQTLVDAGLSFQKGRNRDEEDGARPLATLQVERK